MSQTANWACHYIERFDLALVPLPRAQKAPRHPGWNQDANLIRTPDQTREHWRQHPQDGFGACLEPSRLVSIDADYLDGSRAILAAEGVELDLLIATSPTIVGRAPRLEFRAPADVKLSRRSIVWPAGGKHSQPLTVLEFRAGRLQDVLPPSIHPSTGLPYRWHTLPCYGFPPLPEGLLSLWLNFDAFKHRARNLCPWAPPEPEPIRASQTQYRSSNALSVIAQFNAGHDPACLLEAHGYIKSGARRWKSPCGKGVAGIVQLENGKIYSHHQTDVLAGEHALDAFDLFARLDHGGDTRAAVRAAAELLGLNRRERAA